MARYLRRYTDVLSFLDIVRNNRLTLLSPSTWYDKNDALGLRQYAKWRSAGDGEGAVFALCLAEGKEQAHHWQIFAGHSHGLCIQFDRDDFIGFLNDFKEPPLHGPVIYENLTQVRARNPIDMNVLPFLKRDTFKAEEEYRVVAWEDEFFALATHTIPMPPNVIKRVTFGPSMPRNLADTLKDIALQQPGCTEIEFAISRLINNESWANAIAEGFRSTNVW